MIKESDFGDQLADGQRVFFIDTPRGFEISLWLGEDHGVQASELVGELLHVRGKGKFKAIQEGEHGDTFITLICRRILC